MVARERIRALLKRSGRGGLPLGEAALLVAKGERPDLDVGRYLARLDEHAAMVRRILGAERGAPPRRAIGLLGAYLFRDVGLRGNREDYYDPRNSYLDEVLDRRLGIPITLSIVYIEVGRRAGLVPPPEPISFPGHFFVKHDGPDGPVVVDCFEAGRVLSIEDCERLLEARFGFHVAYAPQLLKAAEPREVLARLCRNLKAIYFKRGDAERAYRIVDQILLFEPAAREERRDRGLLAARLGRLDRAIADLIRYSHAIPDSPQRRSIRDEIDALRARRAMLN